MPDNFNEPAHRLMREIAANGTWNSKLAEASKRLVRESADWYYEHLHGQVSSLNIWRTTYYHTLTGGSGAVVEWFKGTGLQPFLNPLSEVERIRFFRTIPAGNQQSIPRLCRWNRSIAFSPFIYCGHTVSGSFYLLTFRQNKR